MKIAALWLVCAIASGSITHAALPSEILVPGTKLFTESITSTANGTVIIGAMSPGAVFRAKPGTATAELWIKPGTNGLQNVLGVFADEKAKTLWACSYTEEAPKGTTPPPSTLHAFELSTGKPKGKWPLPTAEAMCNDIAVGIDGTAYVSDTRNMEIVVLKPGAKSLEVWARNGAFGPKRSVLDGIAIVRDRVIVNTLKTNRLFSVPIESDGRAGPVAEVKLDRPLNGPDGQRSFGNDGILIVDAGEGGRLMHITLSGEKLDTGKVETLKAGFADGPTSVTVVGQTAYVLEAQFDTADTPPLKPFKAKAVALACPANDTNLTLPAGFCATVFADRIGHARHMAVAPNGVVYVNTWSGDYYGKDPLPPGGFLVALKDSQGLGKADTIRRFGETVETGGKGGTGIALFKGQLYAEINDRIVRYTLPANDLVPQGPPEVIVSGLTMEGEHPMHPFAIDAAGMMYIDVASATNTCQKKNREKESPGLVPCKQLEIRGGIWRYDANKTSQKFSPAERYVSGIRNAGGIAVDSADRIYATQHGRDQLAENWPKLYKGEQGATLPAEEVLHVEQGAVYGWPHCYFDPAQGKLVLAPEYGGDGGKAVGLCAQRRAPIAAFPAHWAPTSIVFYQGTQFPQRYRDGAFIAFHGSWNRAPFQQGGYNVVFQPFKDGKAAPGCEIFADGFAGAVKAPAGATHRPTGLAYGPDGALYISDDVRGRIYRVTYRGEPGGKSTTVGTACPNPSEPPAPEVAVSQQEADLPVPPGARKDTVLAGSRLFHAQGDAVTTCTGCHGAAGTGSPLGPNLADQQWLWSDGSVAGIAKTISEGVPQPKEFRNPMPAMGGAQLTAKQVSAIAAYLWAISQPRE